MTLHKKILLGIAFFLLSVLLPTATFAADICRGYQSGSKTLESGICYYQRDVTLITPKPGAPATDYTTEKGWQSDGGNIKETCSQMAAADYHKNPKYHGISDDVMHCAPFPFGTPYKCCAPDNQKPIGPPVPCTLDKNGNCTQVSTGLGTIQVTPEAVVGDLFGILLGLSGGIAVVIIMISGYRIIFAHNDPEKLKGAREMLTSAIIGLLFIIFSITILRIIGVDILHIPGLSK